MTRRGRSSLIDRMRSAKLIVGLLVFAASCTTADNSVSEQVSTAPEQFISSDPDAYFLSSTFDMVAIMSGGSRAEFSGEFYRDWFSRHLIALKEPSLVSKLNPDTFYVRFLWLRSFHSPVAIRVEIAALKDAELSFTMTDGEGGYDPGGVSTSFTRKLTNEEMVTLGELTGRSELCRSRLGKPAAIDGAQWVFEQRHGNNYCAVNKHSPQNDEFTDLGRFLLQLSGFKESDHQPIY